MRRNPFTLLAALAAFYSYYAIRETGHLVSGLLLGLKVYRTVRYRFLPGFDVLAEPAGVTFRQAGVVILSAPILALAAGYILLAVLIRWGRLIHPAPRLVLGMLCYLTLVLDPIYYAVIPLFRLGGEPETAARLLSISAVPIIATAMGILVLNTYLLQRHVMPLIRDDSPGDSGSP